MVSFTVSLTLDTMQPSNPVPRHHDRWERVERTCYALAQSEIEIALSLLHLAEVEIKGGNRQHAGDLIAKAAAAHHSTIEYLETVPAGLEEEKRELWIGAQQLIEAIRTAERQRRQTTS